MSSVYVSTELTTHIVPGRLWTNLRWNALPGPTIGSFACSLIWSLWRIVQYTDITTKLHIIASVYKIWWKAWKALLDYQRVLLKLANVEVSI